MRRTRGGSRASRQNGTNGQYKFFKRFLKLEISSGIYRASWDAEGQGWGSFALNTPYIISDDGVTSPSFVSQKQKPLKNIEIDKED